MRPVNLIPPEERRGAGAPMRTGRAPYVVIGVMAALVGAVALLVMTNNSLDEKRAEITRLEVEERDAKARAEALAPFAEFAAAREARSATVESLARSRFDWQRVMDELSRIIPSDVWLIQLAGSVSSSVTVKEAPGVAIRGEVPGPALELVGCGRTHESVAGFLSALRDIDGVTRVTAASAERPEASKSSASSNTSSTGASSGECRSRDEISKFEIVVAFDEVPVLQAQPTTPVTPVPAPASGAPTPEPAPSETESTAVSAAGGESS